MTTTVIISSPNPNHQNVLVEIEDLDAKGEPTGRRQIVTLTDGEDTRQYVHGSARLVISEVPKP